MQIVPRQNKPPERLAGPRALLEHERVTVHHGDCLKVMASMPEASVDTIVTDRGGTNDKGILPHYGRGGLSNDRAKFHAKAGIAFQAWCTDWARAALRVAKPGAMLLAFGGTRTFHRLTCAIEDAGWELRDAMTMFYCYGSGFPKSYNIGLAFEHELCECITVRIDGQDVKRWHYKDDEEPARTEPPFRSTDANTWWGYGTALKPAYEIILCAMKPLDGSGFCANALAHGVAGLNVDGGRIGSTVETWPASRSYHAQRGPKPRAAHGSGDGITIKTGDAPSGRWPANVILSHDERCVCVGTQKINEGKQATGHNWDASGNDNPTHVAKNIKSGAHFGEEQADLYACVPGCPVRMLDEQSGITKSTKLKHNPKPAQRHGSALELNTGKSGWVDGMGGGHADSGGASRFFYTAKSSTTERVLGCPPGFVSRHPTVKPLDLCRYLCRLTKTPTGGVVLDPFSGSGSIAVGALLEGRRAIAIEMEEESANATVARVQAALKYGDKLQRLKRYRVKGRKKLKRRR